MNITKLSKLSLVAFTTIATSLISLNANSQNKEQHMAGYHTVTVILDAKPGTENRLKDALLHVKELSQKEDTNIEYRVYQDSKNGTRFVLSEKWTSAEDHAQQFEKEYIKELITILEEVLAEPYQVSMGTEVGA